MTTLLELDIGQLYAAMSFGSVAQGCEVLGPRESVLGSALHEFIKVGPALVLEIQKLRFREPWKLRVARRNSVAFQFVTRGSYRRELDEHVSLIVPATVTIAGSPEAMVIATQRDRELEGVGIYVDREFLVDALGLNVQLLREPYRSIFASELGLPFSLQFVQPPLLTFLIEEILACELPGHLRSRYLSAKSIEIMCVCVDFINRNPAFSNVELTHEMRVIRNILHAASYYRRNMNRPTTLSDVAARVGLNKNQLIAGFRAQFGVSPHKYAFLRRMEKARAEIIKGAVSLPQIAGICGYDSYTAFSRAYKSHFGHSPTETVEATNDLQVRIIR